MRFISSLLLVLILSSPLQGHEWYDPECCSGSDCRPIPCSEIKKVPGGYNYHSIFFSKIKSSQDQYCHACFYGDDPNNPAITGHCLYVPGTS